MRECTTDRLRLPVRNIRGGTCCLAAAAPDQSAHVAALHSSARSTVPLSDSSGRPTYHVKWEWNRAGADIEVLELPGIWSVVPTLDDVPVKSRRLIAEALDINPDSFDIEVLATVKRDYADT